MGTSNVDACKSKVEQAKRSLEIAKDRRAAAKANGNYKKAVKQHGIPGKSGYVNSFDYAVYEAQQNLARAKESLASAKAAAKKK